MEKRKLDQKQKVLLGGLKQKIHVKTEDGSLPVLLFLHGGPGVVNRHFMLNHTDLLESFTLACWDQRGAGGSFWGSQKKDLSITRVTDDAAELVEWLCGEFEKDKIFVIGGSWGSMLGTFLSYRYPEKIAAFVGFGQMVDGNENERISYEFAMEEAKKAGDDKSVKKLLSIGAPQNGVYKGGNRSLIVQRRIMGRYGGYSPDKKKKNYIINIIKPLFFSGEYSLGDIIGALLGYLYVLKAMWPEVASTNLPEACPEFKMPYFILDGRLDQNTPASLVEEYFSKIKAPLKELHWFESSGHNPMGDEPEAFKRVLREKLSAVASSEREKGTRI